MSQTRLYRNHLICNFLEQPPVDAAKEEPPLLSSFAFITHQSPTWTDEEEKTRHKL